MFDFFVHHLSRYETEVDLHPSDQKKRRHWESYLLRLSKMQTVLENVPYNNPKFGDEDNTNGKVIVIQPFHGGHKETGAELYLNLTVKSLSRIFPNIVITV